MLLVRPLKIRLCCVMPPLGLVLHVQLFDKDDSRAIKTYTEAVKTVDPFKSVGKVQSLWVEFAKLYEKKEDLANARIVFKMVRGRR